jgi:hypothetical protein
MTTKRRSPPKKRVAKKAASGADHRRRPPATQGTQITDRDFAMLQWIGRHGVVTPEQIASHFFARDGGGTGTWAAYRRLRKMESLRLIRRDSTFWHWPQVLRLTAAGARYADVGLHPAHLVYAELRHTLALVDLTEKLLAEHPGSTLETERELRALRRSELAAGTRRPGTPGRIPDAVITLRNGKTVAVELDLTPKRRRDLETIIRGYKRESYDQVWWYVLYPTVARVKEILRDNKADDFVTVRAWGS